MGMGGSGSRISVQSEINITPLVDVVLVLLIIFMVATPILQMGLDVEVPPKVEVPTEAPPPTLTQLVVNLRTDGLYLNKNPMTLPQLRDELAKQMLGRTDEDKIVFINADDTVPFDRAVQAIDTAHEAGARKIGFLTEPPK